MPALNLDFARTRRLDPRITFTRASSASYFGADGLLKLAPAGEPRFDFDPLTGVCKGLLIEEARTNLLTYSEQFDNAAWAKARASIVANAVLAPDGTMSADKLVEDTSVTNSHYVYAPINFTAGNSYTKSVFVKDAGRSKVYLHAYNANGAFATVLIRFDLAANSATVTSGSPAGYGITQLADGWFRIWITLVALATASGNISLDLADGTGSQAYTGDGASGIYVWGDQIEAGAFPTSYIPTTSATVSRAADVASMTGANFSSWYNPSEGTFVATATPGGSASSDQSYIFGATDNGSSNLVALYWSGASSILATNIVAGGVTQTSGMNEAANASPRNISRVMAFAYRTNDASVAIAGVKVGVTDTSVTLPVVDRLYLGVGYNGANRWLNGCISRLAYHNTRLDEATLAMLSVLPTAGALPSLVLNFAKSKRLDPRITFSRASSATYFGSDGLLKTAQAGEARFDHDPITLACKGLLIEESRTNLLTYSEQIDNAIWTKNTTTVAVNAAIAPDGSLTADKVSATASAGFHNVTQGVGSKVASTAYTFSFYAKAAEFGYVLPNFSSALTGTQISCLVNLATGAVSSVSAGLTATTQAVGNGWYRIAITATGDATTNGFGSFINTCDASGSGSYTGDGASGVYIWGAQLEAGAFPTSYIATTSASATRSADVATMTGVNFSSWYRQSEGTFVASGDTSALSSVPLIVMPHDGTSNNYLNPILLTSGGAARFSGSVGGVAMGNATTSNTTIANTTFNIASNYAAGSQAVAMNGGSIASAANASVPTVTQMAIGVWRTGTGNCLNGHIARLAYYPKRLTNSELQGLSA